MFYVAYIEAIACNMSLAAYPRSSGKIGLFEYTIQHKQVRNISSSPLIIYVPFLAVTFGIGHAALDS